MTQLKELYKGKSLDDLAPYYKVSDVRKLKLKQLLKTTQKVYEEAEKCLKLGDEELSYIYFMRYFNLIDQIRKSPDYSKEKQYITEILGGQARQLSAMDKAEKLNSSLQKRYKNLQNTSSATVTKTSPLKEKMAIETVTTTTPTLSPQNQNSSKSYHLRNDNDSVIISEADSTSNHKDENERLKSDNKEIQTSMNTCEELYRMIQDPKSSLLIMDCRPKDDFELSRLHYSNCVNVPEEIILPGMSAGVVQQQLESDSKSLWASRSVKDNVILMDWNSQGPEPALYTPIWRLRDILQNWDPDVTYRSPIKILQGGYENYILRYPTQCTNPNVQAPSGHKNEFEFIDDIEYPSINDIIMKDDINYGLSSRKLHNNDNRINLLNERPEIDRKSKLAALKTYGQKQQMLEIIKEQESIVDKTLDTQKKIREAKDRIETITNEFKKTETEDQKNMLLAGQQELIYNILQLQCNEHDYKLEIERLKEQLEEYKRREKELGEANNATIITEKDDENLNLEEAVKRVEVKRDQIDDEEKEKIDMKENQKQLIVVRNEKRHLTPTNTDEDEISKPKIPQFDRSVKPIFKPEPEFIREPRLERDFSPVPGGSPGPGLTGLKNLGNTCYMNSIMQCLSNTAFLVQYFKSNSYKKHINRSNKTKGKIVEEVAELIKVLWSGKFKCVASKDLRYVIGQYQQIFRGIEQQDSHEFLTILMDWLHSDLQTLDVSQSPRDNLSASEKAWLEYTKSMESYILRLFYGQIKSTVKCVTCSKESATYECFSNLSLELPPQMSNRCELYDCLKMYFYGEKINGWNCPNCKEKRNAVKKLDISILPPILVIHLKRFYADSDALGPLYRKKQTYVNFPITNLDMKQYIAPSEQTRTPTSKYHLYAVSNHYGSMESGHYTAFCRSAVLNKWFKFDDQVVSPLDTSDVVSSAAYILFYTRLPE